jgi:glutamine synthetase
VEVDGLIEKGEKKEVAIMEVIKKYIVAAEKVLFEGDGYSEEWHAEAARRGLPNLPTTPLALDAFVAHEAIELFESLSILSHTESEARHEIMLESYIKRVQIEGRIMGELVTSHVLPAAVKYQNVLIENIRGLKELGMPASTYANQLQILEKITKHINEGADLVEKMIQARKNANAIESTRDKAIAYCDDVKPYFDKIRYHVDKLEIHIDDNFWPLPKYREMLFLR